ncbi:hypothetical protein [Pseudoalteromonas aurantia]|uniref:DUF4230 domain-containing protein n=1 Tax=Pseudoalteromonas aurantia TaxID=43654 RepID=A0ABY2W2Z9_9GAMM|nr:hypothetical protein [Pseudoalteromonas aurantia]TMO67731.1 hypothetical protein CWC18_00575 [Pseudoalteromonas aurantia]TMO78981.1 hypothetical protein CWC20_00820 [Pseudoalteromonas aurantia]
MKIQIIIALFIAVLGGVIGAIAFPQQKEIIIPPAPTQFEMPEVTTDLKVISIDSKSFKQHIGKVEDDDYNVIFSYNFIYELGYKLSDHDWCHDLNQEQKTVTLNKPQLIFLNKQFNPELNYLGGLTKEPKLTNLLGPVPNNIAALETVRNKVQDLVHAELTQVGEDMQSNEELNKLGEKALKGLILDIANMSGSGITKILFKDGCS